jgi:hypothetical protein
MLCTGLFTNADIFETRPTRKKPIITGLPSAFHLAMIDKKAPPRRPRWISFFGKMAENLPSEAIPEGFFRPSNFAAGLAFA